MKSCRVYYSWMLQIRSGSADSDILIDAQTILLRVTLSLDKHRPGAKNFIKIGADRYLLL